ncbi:hypothetical protein [Rhodoflexus sp.]
MHNLLIIGFILIGLSAASCTQSSCSINRKGYKKKWNSYNRIQYQ